MREVRRAWESRETVLCMLRCVLARSMTKCVCYSGIVRWSCSTCRVCVVLWVVRSLLRGDNHDLSPAGLDQHLPRSHCVVGT